MRSGLKHLLAYHLTRPNQKCHLINRSFVFSPLMMDLDADCVEIRKDSYTTEWFPYYNAITLNSQNLTIEIDNSLIELFYRNGYVRHQSKILRQDVHYDIIYDLFLASKYKLIMDYCYKLINN
jgi:hypothetical protein